MVITQAMPNARVGSNELVWIFEVTENGTYYVLVKDEFNRTLTDKVEITCIDKTPPGIISECDVKAEDGKIILTYAKPADEDFSRVQVIIYKGKTQGGTFGEKSEGIVEIEKFDSTTNLENDTEYDLHIFSYDKPGNKSTTYHSVEYTTENL